MAEMRIKRKDGSGRWYVLRFVKEHNHKLAYGKLVDYLRSHKKISEEDYGIFGDVLAFDATYGRNKYNLPVVVFSEVNHHNQTCVFATAMVSCDLQASYIWVLRQFLECMQGKTPQSVIMDGDPAMWIAIQSIFPNAHHRLCAWYLLRNATANICDPRFTQLFRHCMLADMEIDEFKAHWEAMLNECGVREVKWVKDLYTKKHAWVTTYICGRFFVGIWTTSRCESLDAKLGRFVESRYGVLEFVTNFQRCVDFLRDTKDELEFHSWYRTPVLQTDFVELEKSGWTKFTREMFVRFWDSLKRCVRVRICELNDTVNPHAYTLQKYRRPKMDWKVYREPISNRFNYTCMRMESFGIPCVHIFAVCVRLDLVEIPESLVLCRWSKAAKMEIYNECIEQYTADRSVTYRTRLGAFSQLCKRLGRVACMSDEDFKLYSKKLLSDAIFLEIKYGIRPSTNVIATVKDCGVKDPIRVRTTGTDRMSQAGDSAAKTKRKCRTCGKLGHRRTRCPNRGAQPSSRNDKAPVGGHKRKRSKVPSVVPEKRQADYPSQSRSDMWEQFSLGDA
ncbi:protein FAR1-RELATED SEQUENCE 5-like [Arachis duranensis]|uniref:Protein FAR1-RELATED SEQUENCE 5-like n=1 Tax=Arachis duranensis TaxID=130453 RepID=A0A6P4C6P1_ARADU|nr:protein FAR1-RELATED SEQUENCE 5-like [Arachis duranensis]